eukprot:gene43219-53649_t
MSVSLGLITAEGKKSTSNGTVTEGIFRDGQPWGYVVKHFPEGDVYCGQLEMNTRTGYGEFIWLDGTKYCGHWHDDCMSGSGVLTTLVNSDSNTANSVNNNSDTENDSGNISSSSGGSVGGSND